MWGFNVAVLLALQMPRDYNSQYTYMAKSFATFHLHFLLEFRNFPANFFLSLVSKPLVNLFPARGSAIYVRDDDDRNDNGAPRTRVRVLLYLCFKRMFYYCVEQHL